MNEVKTEGIVLKAIAYQDKSRIITLFTQDKGIISLFVKKASFYSALTTPFVLGEFIYKKGNKELYSFIDGSLLDPHFSLRNRYESLDIAGKITKTLLTSQLPEKNSFKLYTLFKVYLKKIPFFENPESLLYSFILKLLVHEGLIDTSSTCSICKKKALGLYNGESFCLDHSQAFVTQFSKDEWLIFQLLVSSRNFEELKQLTLTKELCSKIHHVFVSLLDYYKN